MQNRDGAILVENLAVIRSEAQLDPACTYGKPTIDPETLKKALLETYVIDLTTTSPISSSKSNPGGRAGLSVKRKRNKTSVYSPAPTTEKKKKLPKQNVAKLSVVSPGPITTEKKKKLPKQNTKGRRRSSTSRKPSALIDEGDGDDGYGMDNAIDMVLRENNELRTELASLKRAKSHEAGANNELRTELASLKRAKSNKAGANTSKVKTDNPANPNTALLQMHQAVQAATQAHLDTHKENNQKLHALVHAIALPRQSDQSQESLQAKIDASVAKAVLEKQEQHAQMMHQVTQQFIQSQHELLKNQMNK
jgi:hypothetical protein